MRHPKINSKVTSKQMLQNQRFTLLELLDRLLDKGVVVKGEILLSVADIDLVYLNLGLLLSSVKTVEKAARRGGNGEATLISWQTSAEEEFFEEPRLEVAREELTPTPKVLETSQSKGGNGETITRSLPSVIDHGMEQVFKPRANIGPKNVEKGLSKLVLTLVDLIRKLMEKQAVRRMESGFLTAGEVERMGNVFLLLDEKMEELKKNLDLKDEDLNLDLGPLGELI